MNPVLARISLILQLVFFLGGVAGMVFVLHLVEDPAQLQQRVDARMDAIP